MLTEANTPANTALQFSGGKDSLCLLHVMRPHWDRLSVVWLNTGNPFPETVELMDAVRKLVPYFVEVRADQPVNVKEFGFPVDLIPFRNTALGHVMYGTSGVKMQSVSDCCTTNLWKPMHTFMQQRGFTTIIRGQRNSELMKSDVRNGHVANGVTYLMPLQDWSEDDVWEYLKKHDIPVPEHYKVTKTSLDCFDCSAYLHEHGVQAWRKLKHPDMYKVVNERLHAAKAAIKDDIDNLDAILEAV
jgi:phosphoadenosine phosphosulfate reductase